MISYEIITKVKINLRTYVSMPHYYLPSKVPTYYRRYLRGYIKKLIKSTIKVTYVNYLNYLFYAVRIEALTYEGTVRRLDYLFTGYLANVAGRICS
jgi:predicted PolB exonuclease-like 3'-5' exonuclease